VILPPDEEVISVAWKMKVLNFEGAPPASLCRDPKPLGSRGEVIALIKQALPELSWDPGTISAEVLEEFPPDVRSFLSVPRPSAEYAGHNFSMRLSGFELEFVDWLYVELEGDGDSLAFLNRLCAPNRWSVYSLDDDTLVDLSVPSAAQWEYFRTWRNRFAISEQPQKRVRYELW
jgi:hypothetical protein